MSNSTKRIISMVLSLLLLLLPKYVAFAGLSNNTLYGLDNNDMEDLVIIPTSDEYVHKREVIKQTCDVLKIVEQDKASFGLSEVEFSRLFIGEAIPAFLYKEEGLVSQTDIEYYPIIYDNRWVATSVIYYDSAGKMNAQIITDYSRLYSESENDGKVALVFDSQGAYLCLDDRVILAVESNYRVPERKEINPLIGITVPKMLLLSLCKTTPIMGYSYERTTRDITVIGNQYYLYVPGVAQPSGTLACWAACIAAIRWGYGTVTTVDNVYDFAGITKYNGVNIYTSDNIINNYGFSTTWYWDGYFTWIHLTNEIYNNHNPLFSAIFGTGSNIGHVVVIKGYYTYPANMGSSNIGSITYMDPATGYSAATTVATDGVFCYVSPSTSTQYQIGAFLAVSD